MAKQTINLGTTANDGTGDSARVAGDKINDNFTELYTVADGLGSASEANTSDFATAAQGAKADTALQPAAIGVTVQGYSATLAATTASFTTADETKLDGIATGATANDTDANLKARANHTGTQTASTISDFAATVRGTVLTGFSVLVTGAIGATDTILVAFGKLQGIVNAKADRDSDFLTNTTVNGVYLDSSTAAGNFLRDDGTYQPLPGGGDMVQSIYDPAGVSEQLVGETATQTLTNKTLDSPVINSPTGIVKGDVGLGNVDNTSDSTKNSATATLNNKRITMRVQSVTSSATVTPSWDNDDCVTVTAQAAALELANPTGTPTSMQPITIRIKDNGTARAITYGTQYRGIGVTLPTTTVISKTLYLGGMWNAADSKIDIVGYSLQA